MSCGTPCVAFDCSGMPDLIESEVTGYLARPYEPEDLARGIERMVKDEGWRSSLSANARSAVFAKFSPEVIARQHLSLYEDLLASRSKASE